MLEADKLNRQGKEGIAMDTGNYIPNVPDELLCGTKFETCLDLDMDIRHVQS